MDKGGDSRTKIDIRELEEEYLTEGGLFTEDEDIDKLKRIIKYHLSDTEKRLVLLYAHIPSQRQIAKMLQVSPSTINKIINDIREKIRNIKNHKDDSINNSDDSASNNIGTSTYNGNTDDV